MGMFGDQDNIVDPRQWQALQQGLPKSRIERFKEAGHFIMLDEPQVFMQKAQRFSGYQLRNRTNGKYDCEYRPLKVTAQILLEGAQEILGTGNIAEGCRASRAWRQFTMRLGACHGLPLREAGPFLRALEEMLWRARRARAGAAHWPGGFPLWTETALAIRLAF